ncbi:hypothetical protein QR674_14005 [Acinetobacter chinensis]|uniref:Uncharacterized protein n=1 Tax=Acinetobacter chinensis TaxID=2004650 RepID=A0ABU3WI85_9GAMM|nr:MULTISPECIES: hypothetical protein [Acinetobacter]MDV2470094.1 hypothetical protein [Acinetobacter chinensis]WOE42446.1 hypothetical protein QSG87_04745 [Acinetobacter chinensis]
MNSAELMSQTYTDPANTMIELSDQQLSQVQGQALFSLNNIKDNAQGINFYKLAFEASVDLNLNAKSLQLGCGGMNGAGACDIDISQVSFGCITGASGNCISLPATLQNQANGLDANNSISNQTALKNFVLTNPFFQFAIRNSDSAAKREVVGVRIGAEHAEGPMSFGALNSFSGYFTGKANLTMLGEKNVSPVSKENAHFGNASAFLGLQNSEILNVLGIKINYRDLTMDYGTISEKDLKVSVVGNRVTQATIQGLQLGSVVDKIVNGVTVNQICGRGWFNECTGVISPGVANTLLPLLKTGIGNYIKGELASGLHTTADQLNNYQLKYNLTNVHQIDVDSDTFGIALSKELIKYPGYAEAVSRGWSMYLQDAFTLNIEDKVSNLVQNIAATPNAREGNITLLAPAYRNCYGEMKFC